VKSNIYLKTKPTCQMNAIYYYTCECGDVGTNYYIAMNTKTDHSYYREVVNDSTLIVPPTCVKLGLYVRSCNYCTAFDSDINNVFEAGDVNPRKHASMYNKYSVVDDLCHDVVEVCADCSIVTDPITEPHNWVGLCEKKCENCGMFKEEHVVNIKHKIIRNREDYIATPLQKIYGTGSIVAYSVDTPLKYSIELTINNKQQTVYVSELPPASPENLITKPPLSQQDSIIITQLKEVFGKNSIMYSLKYTDRCCYRYNVTVNGVITTIYLSDPPNSNVRNPDCYSYKLVSCACGSKASYIISAQHIGDGNQSCISPETCISCNRIIEGPDRSKHTSDGIVTCVKPEQCIYCNAYLGLPDNHKYVTEYTYVNALLHHEKDVCIYCGDVVNEQDKLHDIGCICKQ
jgi:hypothetical protein